MAGAGLRLEIPELQFRDLTRWRWVLTGPGGEFVADHEVALKPGCWQYEAFADLPGYLSWHAAPDNWREDEARIIAELGAWVGTEVLGSVADALARERPATVRVVFPEAARALLTCPLELAHAGGQPLAAQGVTLIWDVGGEARGAIRGVEGRLRVLGLFSMPEGGQPLSLRRERRRLVDLVNRIDKTGKAADVRVLQYGVTRSRLQEVLEEDEGWDVIHISGHGLPGELLLETTSGDADLVSAEDLASLLDLARDRVKLVTVAACWSAAQTTAEQRRLLGLPIQDRSFPGRTHAGSPAASFGTLATELAARLGCAVLAMRYPVDDEFAIALSGKLYSLLADKGRDLPRAVGMALRELMAPDAAGMRYPALSVATPALFGGCAVDLRLAAPARQAPRTYDTAALKMASFTEPEPERFVGRTSVMARATVALAPDSGLSGVLLHGMPGGGKTACALELAYGHEHEFDRLAWYKAPDQGMGIEGSLTAFALTLEHCLPGFQMAHTLTGQERLDAFLPLLTEIMETSRVLIVIDNAESLLTESGQWRDDRWGQVAGALAGHRGLGRVILTSRMVPAGPWVVRDWDGSPLTERRGGLLMSAVDALSPDEALLLARELPHLDALIRAGSQGGDAARSTALGIDRKTARVLALGVLNVAQGHPYLLKLANDQAEQPKRLAELVAAGDQAWRKQGGLPDGFFSGEATTADPADYMAVLAAWTRVIAGTLSSGERDLFWFLCCLEESDRERPAINIIWPEARDRLGRDGQRPEIDAALSAVAVRGLAAIRPGSEYAVLSYAIHPGVAEAGRAQAGQPFRDAVDASAARFWADVHRITSGEVGGSVHTGMLVRAGLAAIPYYLRQQDWDAVGSLVYDVFLQNPSRATAVAVLPAMQKVAEHVPRMAGALAQVLRLIDPAAAEAMLRAALDDAVSRDDHLAAGMTAALLSDLCLGSGRLAEALHLTEQKASHTRQAGLGPWTRIADAGRRLDVLLAMGQAELVLAEVGRLCARMDALPATPAADDLGVPPWNVREAVFSTGRSAAIELGGWEEALDWNAKVLASRHGRGAPDTEIARARFCGYASLLRLGRINEALGLLRDCRQVFQDAHDTGMLGRVLGALAEIEDERGHGDSALRLERDALRYAYLAGDVPVIKDGYYHLGDYLRRHARRPGLALASHLAFSLLYALITIRDNAAGSPQGTIKIVEIDLRQYGTTADPPRNIADLCDRLADIPGTDLPGLITKLSPALETAEQILAAVIAHAQIRAAQPLSAASAFDRNGAGEKG